MDSTTLCYPMDLVIYPMDLAIWRLRVASERAGLRSHMFTLKLGLLLAPVWFLAQWTYITSLADTRY